jgi:hypothetical protein
MIVFVHRRPSRPERSVLTDDVLADLELAWEAQILNVAIRLGRVQAEQGVVPLPSFVGALREVFDGDQPSVRSRELPDDPTVDDLVGHRSKKGRSTVALPRQANRSGSRPSPSAGRRLFRRLTGPRSGASRACLRVRASASMARGYGGGRPQPSGLPGCFLRRPGVCFLTGAPIRSQIGVAPPLGTPPPVWIGLGRLGNGYCA